MIATCNSGRTKPKNVSLSLDPPRPLAGYIFGEFIQLSPNLAGFRRVGHGFQIGPELIYGLGIIAPLYQDYGEQVIGTGIQVARVQFLGFPGALFGLLQFPEIEFRNGPYVPRLGKIHRIQMSGFVHVFFGVFPLLLTG